MATFAVADDLGLMTVTDVTRSRVDLFTDIHKGIRKGLFDASVQAGATEWGDPGAVRELVNVWTPLVELLRSHTAHENEFIFPLLYGAQDAAVAPAEDHCDLDDLLDDLDERLTEQTARPEPATGNGDTWYGDLNRYIAATLEHLHTEESLVLPALWAARSDDELSTCRAAFLAATPPTVVETTMRLLRGALPPASRRALGLDASASPAGN